MADRGPVTAGPGGIRQTAQLTVVGDAESTLFRLAAEICSLVGIEASTSDDVPNAGPVFVAHLEAAERRAAIDRLLRNDPERLVTLVHPSASVSPQATLGRNVLIGAQSVVAMQARVGDGTWLNALGSIEHDNVIGNHVFFGTAAVLCGRITVGDRAFIGGGATVAPGLTIGADVTVGTGAVVIRDCEPNTTQVGNPARPLG